MLGGAVPQGAGRGCAGGEGGWLLVSPIGGLGSWRFWFGHGVLETPWSTSMSDLDSCTGGRACWEGWEGHGVWGIPGPAPPVSCPRWGGAS